MITVIANILLFLLFALLILVVIGGIIAIMMSPIIIADAELGCAIISKIKDDDLNIILANLHNEPDEWAFSLDDETMVATHNSGKFKLGTKRYYVKINNQEIKINLLQRYRVIKVITPSFEARYKAKGIDINSQIMNTFLNSPTKIAKYRIKN